MIRTLIEVTGEDSWNHNRDLKAALDKLGFEPKRDADHAVFMDDLWQELAERGLDPRELVESQRQKATLRTKP
jgi:hypothetical protein